MNQGKSWSALKILPYGEKNQEINSTLGKMALKSRNCYEKKCISQNWFMQGIITVSIHCKLFRRNNVS